MMTLVEGDTKKGVVVICNAAVHVTILHRA